MAIITIRELLEAGVHFGHEAKRWNPKMRRFIFEERNGIHIIDLQQTLEQVENAYQAVRDTVASGKSVLFVGTKRQAKELIQDAALKAGMFYVTERWLGGFLTNNRTIRKSVGRLREIEGIIADGTIDKLPKKEISSIRREKAKLDHNLSGIKDMTDLPGAIFIVDIKKERIAVAEAKRLGIAIVALVDTNTDPEEIDYPIASNDDAIRAIKLLADKISQACSEGTKLRTVPEGEVKKPRGRRTAQAAAAKPKAPPPEEVKSAAGTEVQAAPGEALAGGEEAPIPESGEPEDVRDLPL
ncbi:MAG: 30S ribosomal protein S2 [Candidatus Aureabacteria bacterium]|nr:30S ribosomal protein S2 [Candidatus Auribacterota bacterium]